MFSIIPEKMRLNKLESRAIMSNKKLYLRARGLTINPEYGKGGTADFTSRELDKLSQSVQSAEYAYIQHLKDNQMPIDTPIDTQESSESE